MTAKYHFITVIWGDTYLDLYRDVVLPSLLTQNNLPAWGPADDSIFRIITDSNGCEKLKSAPQLEELQRTMRLDIVDRSDQIHAPSLGKFRTLTDCQLTAADEAAEEQAAMIFLGADMIWTDGTFARLGQLAEQGYRVVALPVIRVDRDAFCDDLRALGDREVEYSIQELSSHDMVQMALSRLHPLAKSYLWSSPKSNSYSHFYVEVGDEGLLAFCFERFPLFLRPEFPGHKPQFSIDIDYTVRICPDLDSHYIVRDSDEMAGFALDPARVDSLPQYSIDSHKQLWDIARWAACGGTTAHHRQYIRLPMRFHGQPCNEDLWSKAESKIRPIVRSILWRTAAILFWEETLLSWRLRLNLVPLRKKLGSDDILRHCLIWLERQAEAKKSEKISLYGAGQHTERLLRLTTLPKERFTHIVDDSPTKDMHAGLPVVPVGKASEMPTDLLIISSDAHERNMLDRARNWLPPGIPIACLYRLRLLTRR